MCKQTTQNHRHSTCMTIDNIYVTIVIYTIYASK